MGHTYILSFNFQVLEIIDKGPTRWRGMILQEIVTPWMDLAKHEKATGQITTAQFKERVIRGMFYAESAIDCLKNDPKNANMNFDNFSIHC